MELQQVTLTEHVRPLTPLHTSHGGWAEHTPGPGQAHFRVGTDSLSIDCMPLSISAAAHVTCEELCLGEIYLLFYLFDFYV